MANCSAFTLKDILYRMPWQTVLMMLKDRGRTQEKKSETEIVKEEEAHAFFPNVKGYRNRQ
jgi:hypothetical protein